MIRTFAFLLFLAFQIPVATYCQDTTVIYKNQAFTLSDVIVRNNFNIASFIDYVKNDSTFYKAFRNLRVLSFSSFNDIRMSDKKGNEKASLLSTTRQTYAGGCRTIEKAASFEEQMDLIKIHKVLKDEEQKITSQLGTVIFK